mgnify:CR=1 FL=1
MSKNISFKDYDSWLTENIYKPQHDYLLQVLGICGEAGEIAEKMKKIVRDKEGKISEEDRKEILKEAGDVLWYISRLAQSLNSSIEEVAQINMEKVKSRKDRGAIQGEGDNR